MVKIYTLIIYFGLLICLMTNGPFASAATTPGFCTQSSNQFQCIDYTQYFPTTTGGYWDNFADGRPFAYYWYMPGPTIAANGTPSYTSNFQQEYNTFWNLNKSGQLYTIQKSYNTTPAGTPNSTPNYCTETYSNLFLGTDLSVTELGDYMDPTGNSCSTTTWLGYRDPVTGNPTGLSWASPGGLRTEISDLTDNAPTPAETFNLKVLTQAQTYSPTYTNGSTVWNRIKVLEFLPTYTPPYGNSPSGVWGPGYGKTYNNVIHLIFYHGVSAGGPNAPEVTCNQFLDPKWSYSKYYYHMPGYDSYAFEYYMAKGVGIIQETPLLYNEDNPFFGSNSCTGMIIFTPTQLSAMSASSTVEQSNWTAAEAIKMAYIAK